MARDDWSQAEDLADQARAAFRRPGIEEEVGIWVAQARVAAHRGDIPAARQALTHAQRLRPLTTYALPPLAVQVRIELIRVHLSLADIAGARTLMREIDEILRRRPHLGVLVEQAEELRARLAAEGSSLVTASSLTAAELRLLPLLSTHLSAPEIAGELFLSPHTIKAQMRSTYRKLGVSSRNQAVTRARELGLLEG
jgi:LuxR family maltose regulon positive regulatory protein